MRMEHLVRNGRASSIDLFVPGEPRRRRYDPSLVDPSEVERVYGCLMGVELGVVRGGTLVPICRSNGQLEGFRDFCRRCCIVSPLDEGCGRGGRWTPGEDVELMSMYGRGETVEECARSLGRSVGSVKSRLRTLHKRRGDVEEPVR